MTNSNRLPLGSIKVVEFSHAVMGPSCGLILADMGADVIRVEPVTGDPTRRLRGFGIGYYPFYNRNKRCIAVDIKAERGRQIVHQLIKEVDVLVENFGPGTMNRLGYSYGLMKEINPRLIYASLKGFLKGPYEQRHAMDEVVQMMGGLAYMTGPPGQPTRAGASIIDITGGMFAVIGILAALYEREQTGEGTFIKSALFETCAFLMGQHMAYAALSDEPIPPMPARISAWSVYRIFDTKDDRKVFIGLISDKHWERFCRVFEREDLLNDNRLTTNNQRIAERDWLLPDLEKMLSRLTKNEIINRCQEAGIPFAPISTPEDLFDDPQLNQGAGLLKTIFPDGTSTKMPRTPIEYGESDLNLRFNPPDTIGKHTQEILSGLGYSKSEINSLINDKIIVCI
ncbi:MAG: CaiB/BaiF CoA transferase family protein [Fidelibacterota bacterium]